MIIHSDFLLVNATHLPHFVHHRLLHLPFAQFLLLIDKDFLFCHLPFFYFSFFSIWLQLVLASLHHC